MKLSEIPFDGIKIGQRVRSDTTGRLGSVHRKYAKRDARDAEDLFIVIHWDNGHISDNWHFWMNEITVSDEVKMKLNKLNFNSIRIGQYVYDEEHGLTGRVVRGEIGYTRNDSDMLTIEWFHADGTIGVVSCPHQHCDYALIDADDIDMEVIPCDYCGTEITDFENDLKHVSGIIDGEFNNHIHLCKSCFERLKVPEIDLDALRKAANFYTTRRPKTV